MKIQIQVKNGEWWIGQLIVRKITWKEIAKAIQHYIKENANEDNQHQRSIKSIQQD